MSNLKNDFDENGVILVKDAWSNEIIDEVRKEYDS